MASATSPARRSGFDDISFPDTLISRWCSPIHHGIIRGIDFSEAEKVPGFVRALTWKDVPKNIYTILCLIGVGPTMNRCWPGSRCSGRASRSPPSSRRPKLLPPGRRQGRPDLEELPAVFDVEEALKPGARSSSRGGTNYFTTTTSMARATPFRRYAMATSNGFDQADYIVEERYNHQPHRARADRDHRLHCAPGFPTAATPSTPTRRRSSSLDNSVDPAGALSEPAPSAARAAASAGKVTSSSRWILVPDRKKTGWLAGYRYTRQRRCASADAPPGGSIIKDGVMKDGCIIARQVISITTPALQPPLAPMRSPSTPPTCPARTASLTSIDAHCVAHQPPAQQRDARLRRHPGLSLPRCRWTRSPSWWGMDPWEIRFNVTATATCPAPEGSRGRGNLIEVMQAADDRSRSAGQPEGDEFMDKEAQHG